MITHITWQQVIWVQRYCDQQMNLLTKPMKKQNGFTLLELLVVLSISGFVLAGATVMAIRNIDKEKTEIASRSLVNEILSINNILSSKYIEVLDTSGGAIPPTTFKINPVHDVSLPDTSPYKQEIYNDWPSQREYFVPRTCGGTESLDNELGLTASQSVITNDIPCSSSSHLYSLSEVHIKRETGVPSLRPLGEIDYFVRLDGRGGDVNFTIINHAIEVGLAEAGIVSRVEILDSSKALLTPLSDVAYFADADRLDDVLYLKFPLSFSEGYLKADGSVTVNKGDKGLCWDTRNPGSTTVNEICLKALDGIEDELALVDQDGGVAKVALINTLAPIWHSVELTGEPVDVNKRVCPQGTQISSEFLVRSFEGSSPILPGSTLPINKIAIDIDGSATDKWTITSVVKVSDIHDDDNRGLEAHNTGVRGYLVEHCNEVPVSP